MTIVFVTDHEQKKEPASDEMYISMYIDPNSECAPYIGEHS
jgi:hypothetical protein